MDPKSLSSSARKFLELIEFDSDEQLVCEIRKHPFGLFLIYLSGGFVTISLFILLVALPFLVNDSQFGADFSFDRLRPMIVLAGFIFCVITILITLVGAYLYRANVVLVTSEKIAQVLYRTIFDRKISQLSIGDVQDVTVTQNGILARYFNFGTLVIETAGEQQNYTFTYAPAPYECAKQIVGAHERNVALHGN